MTSRLQQKSFAESVISPLPLRLQTGQDLAEQNCRFGELGVFVISELPQCFAIYFCSSAQFSILGHSRARSGRRIFPPPLSLSFVRIGGSLGIRSSPYLAPRLPLCCHLAISSRATGNIDRWQHWTAYPLYGSEVGRSAKKVVFQLPSDNASY